MRFGLYLADQHWERTLSKGIYNYSRMLARAVVPRLVPHESVLVVNRANRQDMDPGGARVVSLPTAASGALRVLADQLAGALGSAQGVDLLHFPKGFVPLLRPGSLRVSATMHDLIPLHYERHHPGWFPAPKLAYLRRAFVHGLRCCQGVLTDSAWSRDALVALAREAGLGVPPVEVCPPAPDPELTRDAGVVRQERRLLHLGSALPHKRTADTIRLFRGWNRRRGGEWTLHVAGLRALPPTWELPPGPDVVPLGPLTRDELRREMGEARALLLLSSVEGFGLPALEAWFLGTPVCYADATSLGEVLAGCPGACADDAGFDAALDEVLALGPEPRGAIRERLRARYSADAFAARSARILRDWLEHPA